MRKKTLPKMLALFLSAIMLFQGGGSVMAMEYVAPETVTEEPTTEIVTEVPTENSGRDIILADTDAVPQPETEIETGDTSEKEVFVSGDQTEKSDQVNETSQTQNDTEKLSTEEKPTQALESEEITEPEKLSEGAAIRESKAENNITVRVNAPEGTFPDGTTGLISSISHEEREQVFDITFTDREGKEVQPNSGKSVGVSFKISASSELIAGQGNVAVKLFHTVDGTTDLIASTETSGESVTLSAEVNHFSEFKLIAEMLPQEETAQLRSNGIRAVTSTNLSDFLTKVVIDAPMDEQGNYIINPNNSYDISLSFKENENLQFDDSSELNYEFPQGMSMGDIPSTAFDINVVDENGSATIAGNTFKLINGKLLVDFNQSDPNFARMQALSNVNFNVRVSASFNQGAEEIVFAPNITKDFVYEELSDVTIQKSVTYDKTTDKASYILKIKSVGKNSNVVIQDTITGTALTLNQDVIVESNLNGVLDITPDYASTPNGFTVIIPQMTDGEELTLRYSATVDNDKITGYGTSEQTNNKATVTSSEVPDGKTAEADLSGKVVFHKIKKERTGEPISIGENKYEIPWAIKVADDKKQTMGGKTIIDYIHSNSAPFMQFAGSGITIEVAQENGSTETRFVPWDQLRTASNDKGIIRWEYDTPASDGKVSYTISYKTVVDTTGIPGKSLTVSNISQIGPHTSDATATIGIIGDDGLEIKKEVTSSTSKESEWKITVHVLKEGYPDLRVIDDLPKLVQGGTNYFDELIEDSLQVEGLLSGESYKLTKNYSASARSLCFDFYQDETQSTTGLKPTADGTPRDIVITFKTTVNQDWLDLSAKNGYPSTNYRHTNVASARVSGYVVYDSAFVTPRKQLFKKEVVGTGSTVIDGVSYPVYHYVLTLENPDVNTADITDSFDTQYLKYNGNDPVRITGGTESGQNEAGGVAYATDTETGMAIRVESFPKDGNGAFYPIYKIHYSLIVKDKAALDELNQAALQNGYVLENTATWGTLTTDPVEVLHTYYPYVDKELLQKPSAENGNVAEFKVVINKYADDLDSESDTLVIQDVLSSNLRFISDSLVISPSDNAIETQYDSETNTLTFTNVPDGARFEITYQARVLGNGNVTYSNTVKFGNYQKTVEEETVIDNSGGGSGSNPSITLVKRDKENVSKTLPGATFQLFYMDGNNQVAVTDKDGNAVTFTTGSNGKVLLIGNQQELGWTLWTGRTYCVVETVAPIGYEPNTEPSYFILSENPASQEEYSISGDSFDVQNQPIKMDISGSKIWDDHDNQDGTRPDEIMVRLMANGEEVGSKVISAADDWAWSFTNLPQFEDGQKIVYTLTEDTVADYTSQVDGFNVTNTHNPGKTTVQVTKAWDDAQNQDGIRPNSVTVELLANGEETGKTLELSDVSQWTGSFENLDEKENGQVIIYTIREIIVPGYTTDISGDATTGFIITNTHEPETLGVSGSKTWVDNNNQDGIRPDSITVRLYADGIEVKQVVVTEAMQWEYSFANLPKYSNGVEILYTITEDTVADYTTTIDGFDLTNTHNPGKTNVHVIKTWDDKQNQDGIRPDRVIVKLLADGTDTGKKVELSPDNQWTSSFDDLDQKTDGRDIVYSIEEEAVEGYTAQIVGNAEAGFTIRNAHEPKTIKVTGNKTWEDNNDQDGSRPDSITVRLLANGTEIQSKSISVKEGWAWSFDNLPKYKDGEEVIYTITEDAVPDYTAKVDGYSITNTHTPGKTAIQVTKAWNDTDNKDGIRPKSVTIHLWADGKDTEKTIVLSADNKWAGSFDGLDAKANGKTISYTITEDAVSGYTTTIAGNAEKGYTVTNSHTPKDDHPSTPKDRASVPKTGDSSGISFYLGLMLLSLAGLLSTLIYRRKYQCNK